MGGQIIGYTNRLSKVTCDETVKLGAAVCLNFNLNKAQYASIGTYWPCMNKEEGSFQRLIEGAYGGLSAIATLKHGIAMAVEAAGSRGHLVLVGGDFNSDMLRADQYHIRHWAGDAGLTEASTGAWALRPSFCRPKKDGLVETRIDHVFTSDVTAVLSSAPVDPDGLVSHHLMMITRLDVAYCNKMAVFKGIKRVNLMHSVTNRSNRIGAVCQRLEEEDLLDWDNPEAFLAFVGLETVKVCTLSKGVRREKNGWSPVTKGLTMNLRAIVTMLRHVHGYRAHKNLQWTEMNFRPGLNAVLRKKAPAWWKDCPHG